MAASLMKSLCGSEGWPGHVPTTPCQNLPALWECFSSHVAIPSTLIVCICCVLDGWNMHICFFHVSVSQHEAKLSQHHQHGQVGENTEAQV